MTFMNAQGLLDKIEDILEMGSKIPLSGKVAVDAEQIKKCIEDVLYLKTVDAEDAEKIINSPNKL